MAKETVIKIKEAEDAAAEVVRAANEKARLLTEEKLKEALKEKEGIVKSAEKTKDTLAENARTEAEAKYAPIIAEGREEIKRIQNPEPAKFEQAVKTVMERIVNVNGNR